MTKEDENRDMLIAYLSDKANSYCRAYEKAEKLVLSLEKKLSDFEAFRSEPSVYMVESERHLDLAAAAYRDLKRSKIIKKSSYFLRMVFGREDPDMRLLRNSSLFDSNWYRYRYPDVGLAGLDPIRHYVNHGYAEGRWPCALFDTRYYFKNNTDVLREGINPLVHYIKFGASEFRKPNKLFDTGWYVEKYPQFRSDAADPLSHYLKFGESGSFDPNSDFSSKRFQNDHPQISFATHSPLAFALHGWDRAPY